MYMYIGDGLHAGNGVWVNWCMDRSGSVVGDAVESVGLHLVETISRSEEREGSFTPIY